MAKSIPERLEELTLEVRELKTALVGDKDLGITGPIERIFDKFDELPCHDHATRIDVMEDKQMVNSALANQRNKWFDRMIKIGIPAGAGAGIIAWAEKIFGGA